MNAYLIAAKANAWEVEQHVSRAIDADQPAYRIEEIGRGTGCFKEDREKMLGSHRLFSKFFSAN